MKDAGHKVMLLHSRFTYGDRDEKERKLMHNLKDYDFVVATQVVEVSLDVSFESILTEPATLDALIQRFGRVNRRGFGNPRDVYILTEGSENDDKIYNPYKIVEKSIKILEDFNGEPLWESKIPELISDAYSPASEKLEKEVVNCWETAKDLFSDLKPLGHGEDESQFYEMFQGLEVVPSKFEGKVTELIDKGKGIEVQKYLVPLPYWKYYAIINNFGEVFNHSKVKNKGFIVANLKYSKELGLLNEPSETEIV